MFEYNLIKLANLINYGNEQHWYKLKNLLLRNAGLKIGKVVHVSSGFECIMPKNIELSDNISIGHNNVFWAFDKIKIGQFVQTARDVSIVAGSHESDIFKPKANQQVTIGSGTWIGTRVTILGGVKIGKGCIIGAGSVVNKDIPDWSIVGGVPAKVIKMREPAEKIIHPAREYTLEELKSLEF